MSRPPTCRFLLSNQYSTCSALVLTVADIDTWNSDDLAVFAGVCRGIADHCESMAAPLFDPGALFSWEGEAAEGAREAMRASGREIGQHGDDAAELGRALDVAVRDVREVKDGLAAIRKDVAVWSLLLDPVACVVHDPDPPEMRGWSQDEKIAYYETVRTLQGRTNDLLSTADRVDRDLAVIVNGLLGDPSPGADAGQSDRHQAQSEAFRQIYGREPSCVNDWRMAEALDPGTYSSDTRGATAKVVVGTIEPQAGYGVVRTNLYIPGAEAQNFTVNPVDVLDGRAFPNNLGDNRAPSAYATAAQSRVSVFVDYENGVVVARQNPTVVTSGPNPPAADDPQIRVAQAPDGSVRVNYFATDTYQPEGGKLLGIGVEGDLTMTPNPRGHAVSVGGTIGSFPSAEMYQYHNDGNVDPLLNYEATGSEWGPLTNLVMGPNNEVGVAVTQVGEEPRASPQMGYPGSQQSSAPLVGTLLGPPSNPPQIAIVEGR